MDCIAVARRKPYFFRHCYDIHSLKYLKQIVEFWSEALSTEVSDDFDLDYNGPWF